MALTTWRPVGRRVRRGHLLLRVVLLSRNGASHRGTRRGLYTRAGGRVPGTGCPPHGLVPHERLPRRSDTARAELDTRPRAWAPLRQRDTPCQWQSCARTTVTDPVLTAADLARWLARIGRGSDTRSAQRFLVTLAAQGVPTVQVPTAGRPRRGVTRSVLAAHLGVDPREME